MSGSLDAKQVNNNETKKNSNYFINNYIVDTCTSECVGGELWTNSSTVSRHTHRAIFATTTTSIMATTTTTITTTMTMMTLRTISTTMHHQLTTMALERGGERCVGDAYVWRRRVERSHERSHRCSRGCSRTFYDYHLCIFATSYYYFRILGCASSTSKHSSNNENFHSRFLLSSNSKFVC